MSLLTSLAKMLGAGGELVLALSVGLIAWYLIKLLSGAKTAGSVLGEAIRMLAFACGVLAVGIWRDWWDPDFGQLTNDAMTAGRMLVEYGMDLVSKLLDLGVVAGP